MTATPEVDSHSAATSIRNPATGAVAGQVRWTDPADVARIAAGLREAQKEWEVRGAKGRAKVLARYAVWLGEHRDEIESLLIRETGKSAVDAAQEVPLLIMILSYYIKTMEKALAPEARPASLPFLAIKKVTVYYRPRHVVGIIAPELTTHIRWASASSRKVLDDRLHPLSFAINFEFLTCGKESVPKELGCVR